MHTYMHACMHACTYNARTSEVVCTSSSSLQFTGTAAISASIAEPNSSSPAP